MKRLFPILLLLALFLNACDNYDSWTTDQSARLTFSADTVDFDTLITTIGSSTERVLAFNNNNKGLRITNVWLKHGTSSPFRVNVDGEYLSRGSGTDFEVHATDSIFILLETTLPETANIDDTVTAFTDSLCFQLESGRVQYIVLKAEGQNAEHHHGVWKIESDTTFSSTHPIIIYDSLYIAPSATLTLDGGTTLMFHGRGQTGASMQVDGTLTVNGTLDKPVIFRGDRMDNMFSYLPYDNTPQQWGGVFLYGKGRQNKLDYLNMHGSITGLTARGTDIELNNCIFYNAAGNAFTAKNSNVHAVNTQISNSYGHLFHMIGGQAQFDHCTLAQFNNYSSEMGYALMMQDWDIELKDTMFYDITGLTFNNCIITGYDDDVIMGDLIKERKTGQETSYMFRNCYISTDSMQQVADSVEHKHWIGNRFAVQEDSVSYGKIFQKFDDRQYIYDFTPDSAASFRGIAESVVAAKYPTDRLGRERPADKADPGAYQQTKYANNPTSRRKDNRPSYNSAH